MSEFWDNIITTEEVCPNNVKKACKKHLKYFKDNYPGFAVKDKLWEAILTSSFREENYKCVWLSEFGDSHKSGADIIVEGLKHNRISCKSGTINFNKKLSINLNLEISGCRTSSHKTINEKLIYLDNNHEDIIYSLSSTLLFQYNKYILNIFIPPKFSELNWTQVITEDNKINYVSDKLNGVQAEMKASLSDQLWYSIDYYSPLILDRYEIQL